MPGAVDSVISEALRAGASDIFISEGGSARARVAGAIRKLEVDALTRKDMVDFWSACGVSPHDSSDHDCRYLHAEQSQFLRVNLHMKMGVLAAVLRPVKTVIPEMEELGLPVNVLREWFSRPSGLILVTGASGSGKSTTIASALQDMSRRRESHILTIEDPVEYFFRNDRSFFTQREIGTDSDSFGSALRSSLRQNPDVIFIGEIRDFETADIALRSAESGHLIAATLHSSGAVEAIDRLKLLFPASMREGVRSVLAQQIIGIASQSLVPARGGGVTPICELMQAEAAVRKWLKEDRMNEISELLDRAATGVSVGFVRELVNAVESGRISEEEGRRAARNPHDFNRLVSGLK